MFTFRKLQSTLLKTLYCTMCRRFRSLVQKSIVCYPVTSLRRQSRLYVREWDGGRKERTFVL